MSKGKDFLRRIVQADLDAGKYDHIVTRFPPEPNGFPHIGHAKSISINFGIARDYDGICHLRMDDTNPTTEETRYVDALKDAVKWLGFEWDGEVRHTSDYFNTLYQYAIKLIKLNKAYVDSLDEEQMKAYRGTVTQPGRRSRYADRSVGENLDLLERMKNGEFTDGEHVLRARIDMGAPNMKMRDPLLYRIRNIPHHRAGDKWAIYPMYDFAHPLSDYIEGVTHSICTLEFENNREIYDWLIDTLELEPPRPYQHEFARLNINYTVMSKRKLLELVEGGFVKGWDDPRLPTIAGLRRRGYTPESILSFCDQIGIAKANSTVDIAQLEFAIRDDLNLKVPRAMCVLDPLKITISNYEEVQEIEASYYPHDTPQNSSRKLPFSREIYIERDDFSTNPPKGYYRLTPDQPVRLKHAYIISCQEVITDTNGNITEIIAQYYPDSRSGSDTSGIQVKSAIQWVEASHAVEAEIRLYDRLYKVEAPVGTEDLNPDSLQIIPNALVEPAIIDNPPDERFQFERLGYFYADPADYTKSKPVFNRIVTLKDSWIKRSKPTPVTQPKATPKHQQIDGEVTPMNDNEQKLYKHYTDELGLGSTVAEMIARDSRLVEFFDLAIEAYDAPSSIANIVANDVSRVLKSQQISELLFTPDQIAKLVKLMDGEVISTKIAKEIFEIISTEGGDPVEIVESKGLKQISDPQIITSIITEIMAKNPENVQKYREGNQKLFGFFVGQVLKATQGKANPKVVNELLRQMLD